MKIINLKLICIYESSNRHKHPTPNMGEKNAGFFFKELKGEKHTRQTIKDWDDQEGT